MIHRDTGAVLARCAAPEGRATQPLGVEHLSSCTALSGVLIAGHVRFATAARPPDRALVDPDAPAIPLRVRVTLTSVGHPPPAWQCDDDSPDAPTAAPGPPQTGVRYACVIQPAGRPPAWSGRVDLVPEGWALGTTADTLRVCRYSADHNGNGRIDNEEHPAEHTQVTGPLADQNFLVVAGDTDCPALPPATTPGRGVLTEPHQP